MIDSTPRQLVLEFSVHESLFLDSNKLNNMHHTTRAPITKDLKELGRVEMLNKLRGKATHDKPYMGRAVAAVTIAWPDRIRRDTHNYMPLMKPIMDGFIAAGLLEDDREEFLIGPHLYPADRLYKATYGKRAMLQWVITEIPARVKF